MPPARSARPPYYAVLIHRPSPETDARLHLETLERLVGVAAAEPSFLGIEDTADGTGERFTVCYWQEAAALRRWHQDALRFLPAGMAAEALIGPTGCFWPWLTSIQEAQSRRQPGFEMPAYEPYEDDPPIAERRRGHS